MPRAPRNLVVVPGLPHHVILRGNNRRRLFSYDGCYLAFLRLLRGASQRSCVPVHGLTLMANHVHLLVTPADAPTLAGFVKSVAQRYAMRRNQARNTTGKLFEQRYLALPILDEAYLAATLTYVDLNPVHAGLVQEGSDYRWSTCALHSGGTPHPAVQAVWTPHPWYLGLAADSSRRAARYVELLASRSKAELDALADMTSDRDEADALVQPPRRPDRRLAT